MEDMQITKKARLSVEWERERYLLKSLENLQLKQLEVSVINRLYEYIEAQTFSGDESFIRTAGLINDIHSYFGHVRRFYGRNSENNKDVNEDTETQTLFSNADDDDTINLDEITGFVLGQSVSYQTIQTPPVTAALSNHLILSEIFKYLTFQDLKNVRGMCKLWNNLGTETMLARDSFKINLLDNPSDDDVRVWASYSDKTVEMLTAVMDSSETFPCASFEVHSEMLTRLIPFFAVVGSQVSTLTILGLQAIDNLGVVLKQCPLLQTLKLDLCNLKSDCIAESFFRYFPYCSDRRANQVFLAALKFVEIVVDEKSGKPGLENDVLKAIIRAAPNLKEIQNFQPCLTEAVFLTQKFDLIKSLEFKVTKYNLEHYQELANHHLSLQQLTLESSRMTPQKIDIISKILLQSSGSVQKLSTDPLGVLKESNLTFAPFQQLSYLCIHARNVSSSLLPGGFSFNGPMFPNLKFIRFEIRMKSPGVRCLFAKPKINNNEEAFRQSKTVPSVECVEIMNAVDKIGLQLVTETFPCLRRLTFKETYFPVKLTGSRIWELLPQTIEMLCLHDSTFHFNIEEKNFDYIFTGMPLDTCKNLRDNCGANANNYQLAAPAGKRKPWIGDLKNLKGVKFTIHEEEFYQHQDWILSLVSVKFAFEWVPDLRVTIAYDKHHSSARGVAAKLKPLVPFVMLAHQPIDA